MRQYLAKNQGSIYGDILPIEKDNKGNLSWGMPSLARDALLAASEFIAMPYAAYSGEMYLSPGQVSQSDLNKIIAGSMEMGLGSGTASRLGRNNAHSANIRLANDEPRMYNPPKKPQRPFKEDYPNGAQTDNRGRLVKDIDGRPLSARTVVGRTEDGGRDTGIPPKVYDEISEGLMGRTPEIRRRDSFETGVLGETGFNSVTKKPIKINISDAIKDQKLFSDVYGHEVGHAIDQMALEIPTEGIDTELRQIFHTLSTGNERKRNLISPELGGYDAENVPRELMAEAIRAYMVDPNYIKTVAPNAAARIRQYVNANSDINKIIQFNSIGGIGLLGAGVALNNDASERDHYPRYE